MLHQIPAFRLSVTGFVSLAMAMGVGRFAYTPLLPMMREDGLITISQGGIVASVHFLGYFMGALMAARMPLSPVNMMRLSVLSIGGATVGMGLVDGVIAYSVLRWVAGVCSAWVLILVGNFVVRTLADTGHAGRQGIVFSGVGGGIMVMGLACLIFMTNGTDSAESWIWVGGVSLLIGCLLCLTSGTEMPTSRVTGGSEGGARRNLIWPMIAGYGMAGFGYSIPATYLPVMARDIVSDPLVFGWSWPLFGAAAMISTVVASGLRRRFSSLGIWIFCQFIMAAGVIIPVISPVISGMATSGLLVGGTFMIITMAGMQEAHRVAPKADVFRHIAAMTTAFATGQMAGPVLAGFVHAFTGSFNAVLVTTSVLLVLSAVPLIFSRSLKAELV